jgi:hypothetical protein
LPPEIADHADHMRLEVELSCDHECPLEAWRIDPDMRARRVGIATTRPGEWIALRTPLSGQDLGIIETLSRSPASEEQSESVPLISDQSSIEPLSELSADDGGAPDLQPVVGENDVQPQPPESNADDQEPPANDADDQELPESSTAQFEVERQSFTEARSMEVHAEDLNASEVPSTGASTKGRDESDEPESQPAQADDRGLAAANLGPEEVLVAPGAAEAYVQDQEAPEPSSTKLNAPARTAAEPPLLEFNAGDQTTGGASPSNSEPVSTAASERHGSGRVVVTGLRFLDESGEECLHLDHGKSYSIVLSYQINDPTLKEHCQVVFAFKRNGVDDVFRLYGKELLFDASKASRGEIVARVDRLPLGVGEYSITVLVAGESYYEEKPTLFYTLNPKVYWAARGVLDIKVVSEHLIPMGTGAVGQARWYLR